MNLSRRQAIRWRPLRLLLRFGSKFSTPDGTMHQSAKEPGEPRDQNLIVGRLSQGWRIGADTDNASICSEWSRRLFKNRDLIRFFE